MIRITPTIRDMTATTVTVTLVFDDDRETGIREARVWGARGAEIPLDQPEGCPDPWPATVIVDRLDLPLLAEATNCAGEVTPRDANGPLLSPDPIGPGPGGILPCSPLVTTCASECFGASEEADSAWFSLRNACESCGDLRRQQAEAYLMATAYAAAATIALVMSAVFVALAIASGNVFGAIIFGAFAFACLIGAIVLTVMAGEWFARGAALGDEAGRCEAGAAAARSRFEDAIQVIEARCPCPECGPAHLAPPC